MVDDTDIVRRIDEVIQAEHEIHSAHEGEGVDDGDRRRLESIEVALDQCWTCCASAGRGGTPDRTRRRPRLVQDRWSRDTSSDGARRVGGTGSRVGPAGPGIGEKGALGSP